MALSPSQIRELMQGGAESLEEKKPDLGKLGEVGELAKELLAAQAKSEELGILLEEQNDKIKLLAEVRIPALMEEMQITEIKLDTGHKVKMKRDWQAHLSEANRQAGCDFMVKGGFADLIKNEVSLKFGKGEEDALAAVKAVLADGGFTYTLKESIHPSTLKAFVKERMESGEEFPGELFGAHLVKKAEIKNK